MQETRINGKAISDYKDFDVSETGLAVLKAEPLYTPAISNGYALDDFIVDDSLVLYFPLWALKGSKFKSVDRYRHTCTLTDTLWRPNGRYFDGVGSRIELLDSKTAINIPEGTIEFWLNPTDVSVDQQLIALKDGAGRNLGDFQCGIGASGDLVYLTLDDGSSVKTIYSDSAPTDGVWIHLVFLWGTGGMKMYIDLVVQAGTNVYTGGMTNNSEIFQLGHSSLSFYGLIGETRLYSRRLSVAEMTHNRNATIWRFP